MVKGCFDIKIDFENNPVLKAKKKTKKQMDDLLDELGRKFA